MSRTSLPSPKQHQLAIHLRELSGHAECRAAFRCELKLGGQVICSHRDRPNDSCLAGFQQPVALTVESIQTNNVRFTKPNGTFQCCRFLTYTCGTCLEHLEGRFVLQHPEGDRLISHWLNGAPHAQA